MRPNLSYIIDNEVFVEPFHGGGNIDAKRVPKSGFEILEAYFEVQQNKVAQIQNRPPFSIEIENAKFIAKALNLQVRSANVCTFAPTPPYWEQDPPCTNFSSPFLSGWLAVCTA